ncbi:MAG: LytR C-terminal domain-containing protein [Acidimicrobiales bacterium]|nr:LytR C-terminal domain-containing protein [Acidimicrobiales bacterium]
MSDLPRPDAPQQGAGQARPLPGAPVSDDEDPLAILAAAPSQRTGKRSRGARTPRPPGSEGSPEVASLRGALLIVGSVILGVVVLAKGYQTEGNLVAGSSPTTVGETTTTRPLASTSTATTEPPSTTVPLKPPGSIAVRVANAGGQEGVAIKGTQKLQALGYKTLPAVDDPVKLPQSKVFYQGELRAEAIEIAKQFGIPEERVEQMSTPPPVAANGAEVLVDLGAEQKL